MHPDMAYIATLLLGLRKAWNELTEIAHPHGAFVLVPSEEFADLEQAMGPVIEFVEDLEIEEDEE